MFNFKLLCIAITYFCIMEQSLNDGKDVCDVRNIYYVPQNIILVFQVRVTRREVASRSICQLLSSIWQELETPQLYSKVHIYYAGHKHLLHHELIAPWCKSKLSQYITGNFRKIQPFYFTPSIMLLVCWKFLQSSNCVNCKQLSTKKN